MIEVRCFHSLEEAAFLRAQVNALNLQSVRPEPFSTFEFFENYLRHDEEFPQGAGLRIWFLAAFSAQQLVGYLVLKEVEHRVLGARSRKLDFLVTHDTDRPRLVALPAEACAVSEAFYRYLLSRSSEWSYLELQQQDPSSPLFPPPSAVDLGRYRVREWPCMENGTVHLEWPTLEAYFRAMAKKFRSNLSRQMRLLFDAGELRYLSSSSPQTTPALFELYRTIEPYSWKSQAGAAIGRHPRRVAYFKSLLEPSAPMRVTVHLLTLDQVPVAGFITGAFGKALYALHIMFDDRLDRFAPGSAVLLMGMRQAIEGNFEHFNLLSGFGYYKARWLAQMTPARNAQIYRIGKPFFWRSLLGDLRRRALDAPTCDDPVRYNPARRQVTGDDERSEREEAKAVVSPEERTKIDALTAQVLSGPGEFLSPSQLAALMPFETRRSAADSAVKRGSTQPEAIESLAAATRL